MSWNTISKSDALAEFSATEQAALERIQGSTTKLDALLLAAVQLARGSIRAGGNGVSATSNTIPDQVRRDVIAIAIWDWLRASPKLETMQTEARAQACKEALARLDNIAAGKPKMEQPADPDGGTPLVTRPSITARPRTATLADQEGL